MKVYFSGIGGVGIGPLAEIAHDAGYQVVGSDKNLESLTVKELQKLGLKISSNQDGQFLEAENKQQPIDWFVYSSAISQDNPELLKAISLGIKTSKRDHFLSQFIEDHKLKLIAIAGTHGKTTTTSMIVWAFKQLGLPISYSVGTEISFGKMGVYNPSSQYFVYECDEFDRNFLAYKPYLALIPAVDYDHSETYPTVENYLAAFKQFATRSQQVITWSKQQVQTYAGLTNVKILSEKNDICPQITLSGEKNRLNASLAFKALNYLGINSAKLPEILSAYPGATRRFEKLADNLYTDYAHHPTEIAATIELALETNPNVVVIYEPHQNIRQHQLINQYKDCFNGVKALYWLPTFLTREDPKLTILKPSDLIEHLASPAIARPASLDQQLWQTITALRNQNNLVLCLGAGTIDSWLRTNLKK